MSGVSSWVFQSTRAILQQNYELISISILDLDDVQ